MPNLKQVHVGGSFAPPLTDDLMAAYRAMFDKVDPQSQLRAALDVCYACCSKWWELPESTNGNTKMHPTGRGVIQALDDSIAKDLWEHIPWTSEIDTFANLFERISNETNKPLRDAAHHLLWHVRELDLDREPLTKDKL